MAETPPAVQCPSCGSPDVAPVSLWMIPVQYYECRGCKVTFRESRSAQEPPDVARFNDGWTVPPAKPDKPKSD